MKRPSVIVKSVADSYTICKLCDHFVEENPDHDNDESLATFLHMEDGEQEFDHDATPGESMSGDAWDQRRPDLFKEHPDGKVGPNSSYHSQRGKLPANHSQKVNGQ